MALSDLSFKLYTDTNLTSVFTGTLQTTHQSDLSDGAQDFVYYFGSALSSKQLQASSDPGVDNIVLTPTYILDSWVAATAYSLGDSIIPATPNGYRYECTTAGTSGGSAPTWGVTLNGTTTDNTAVWTLVAEDSPTTEIKLALTLVGLDSATGGAALSLGNTITSGAVNNVEVHIRLTNTITAVSDSYSTPELGININQVEETSV